MPQLLLSLTLKHLNTYFFCNEILCTQRSSCFNRRKEFVNNWRVWRDVNYLFNSGGFISSYISSFCPDPAMPQDWHWHGHYGIDIFRLKVSHLICLFQKSNLFALRHLVIPVFVVLLLTTVVTNIPLSCQLSAVGFFSIWSLVVYVIKPFLNFE